MLAEREQIQLSRATVHRILKAAGIPSPRRRRAPRAQHFRAAIRQLLEVSELVAQLLALAVSIVLRSERFVDRLTRRDPVRQSVGSNYGG